MLRCGLKNESGSEVRALAALKDMQASLFLKLNDVFTILYDFQ